MSDIRIVGSFLSPYVRKVLALLRPFEELCLKTPPASHREALREAGVRITATTVGIDVPRRGIMKI
jgi:hypothetical protein